MGTYDRLTIQEENFIKENSTKMSIGEIASSLGRSYFTVQKTMRLLGLHCYHSWKEEEDAVLIMNYGKVSTSKLAELFGVDNWCIYNRVRRLKRKGRIENDSGDAKGI